MRRWLNVGDKLGDEGRWWHVMGLVFTALDCQQSVWTSVRTEWCRVPAVKPNQYRLHPAWRTLRL